MDEAHAILINIIKPHPFIVGVLMNYLLAAVFCITYTYAVPLIATDFISLAELETATIHKGASDVVNTLDLTQEQHQVCLNYLCSATQSAKCEHAFVQQYAEFQKTLAQVKESRLLSDEDRAIMARRFAALKQLVEMKAEYGNVLHHIEDYIDRHEEYADVIDILRQGLTEALTAALEHRSQLIEDMLLESDNNLKDGMLRVLGRFCRTLAEEPELLVQEASLALSRVDVINKISQELDKKIVIATKVKDAMDEIVYFTLLITYHFFKNCYDDLYVQYQATYDIKPVHLFNNSGKLIDEQRDVLPKDLLV